MTFWVFMMWVVGAWIAGWCSRIVYDRVCYPLMGITETALDPTGKSVEIRMVASDLRERRPAGEIRSRAFCVQPTGGMGMQGIPLAGLVGNGTGLGSIYQDQRNALQPTAEPPKTIASAISRVESLNGRLSDIRSQIAGLSDMIGGPRNLAGDACKNTASAPTGVVYRLNDSAEQAHATLSDIESLLSSISRALG